MYVREEKRTTHEECDKKTHEGCDNINNKKKMRDDFATYATTLGHACSNANTSSLFHSNVAYSVAGSKMGK